MATDTLEIFGTEYTGVTGIKATDDNDNTKVYIRPQGTKQISANGTNIDVAAYATADVSILPVLQTISKSYTPSTSAQSETISAGTGFDGISQVSVSIDAMPSGSATGPSSVSGTGATVNTPMANTLVLSKSNVPITPVVSAGYVSEGTASSATVMLTAQVPLKAATTYTPGTTDQTIASGTYLTGTQTISGDSDLVAGNIKKDVSIFGVTGTYEGGGSVNIDTKTVTATGRPSSLSFTSMKGNPKAFYLRATFTMTSSSSTYYYVDSMRYNGDDTQGRLFRMGSTRQTEPVASGYSYSYSGTTLTVSSTGNRTTSPGCFYNGSYELVYVY